MADYLRRWEEDWMRMTGGIPSGNGNRRGEWI